MDPLLVEDGEAVGLVAVKILDAVSVASTLAIEPKQLGVRAVSRRVPPNPLKACRAIGCKDSLSLQLIIRATYYYSRQPNSQRKTQN
jgi:hypothetical protein